jgi:chromosome segregation ATPase
MPIKESQIKATLEEYLNVESGLQDYSLAQAEASEKYKHLLNEHKRADQSYNIHTATPIISSYSEVKELDRKEEEAHHKLNELQEKIKEYIIALNGASLHVDFTYDELNHRAGAHTFYLENGELKTQHTPIP